MDWQRLAEEVERQRGRLGYGSRGAFAAATHFAEKTLGDIENARRQNYGRATMARLESALRWPPGTADAILRGGRVPSLATVTPHASDVPGLVEALSAPPADGQLVDTIRHFLANLSEPYRGAFREMLQRDTEWGMWAQQNADAMREVAEVAGWDPGHEQVTPAPPGRQSVP